MKKLTKSGYTADRYHLYGRLFLKPIAYREVGEEQKRRKPSTSPTTMLKTQARQIWRKVSDVEKSYGELDK
jgi:hypothetical protein